MINHTIRIKYILGHTIITMSMLNLFMALYFLQPNLNWYLTLFNLWLDQYTLWVGGVGVNGREVFFLGSILTLVFGLGLGGWYFWKRILPIAGAIRIGKVSTVLDQTILENSWQCGHCGLRFKIGIWGKTVIYGGELAGSVIYTCPNCKRPVRSDKLHLEKEPVDDFNLDLLQKLLLDRKDSNGNESVEDEAPEPTPRTKEEAVNHILGIKNEPDKVEERMVPCPDCGNYYTEGGMDKHRGIHKKKQIKRVKVESDTEAETTDVL